MFAPSTSQTRTTTIPEAISYSANTNSKSKKTRKISLRNQPNFQCKLCMKYLTRKATLNRHYRQLHGLNMQEINRFDNRPLRNVLQVRLVRKEKPLEENNSNDLNVNNQESSNVSENSNNTVLNPVDTMQNCSMNSVHDDSTNQQQQDVFVIDEYLDESVDIEDFNDFDFI